MKKVVFTNVHDKLVSISVSHIVAVYETEEKDSTIIYVSGSHSFLVKHDYSHVMSAISKADKSLLT